MSFKVVLKCVAMDYGALSVMMDGPALMPVLCVDNLVLPDRVWYKQIVNLVKLWSDQLILMLTF